MVKKTEMELKAMADLISNSITIRTYDADGSNDTERKSEPNEKTVLFNIVYGALLGFNWGASTEERAQAIADTAEFTVNQFFGNNKDCINGYLSVYRPLKEAFKLWEE